MATYGVFASLGPSLFAYGVGIAYEREVGQLALDQITPLPLPVPLSLGAKPLTCIGSKARAVLALYAPAAWGGGVMLPRATWLALALETTAQPSLGASRVSTPTARLPTWSFEPASCPVA